MLLVKSSCPETFEKWIWEGWVRWDGGDLRLRWEFYTLCEKERT